MSLQACHSPVSCRSPAAGAADSHGSRVVALMPELRRYALQLARNPSDADDLVQDTVERALAKHHQFAEGTSLRSWLFTILRNRFLTNCRDRRRWGNAEDYANAVGAASVPPSQDDSAEVSALGRAFEKLPMRDQLVIELAAFRGLNYEAIAGMLKVPSGTVRSRLSRARKRLSDIANRGAPSVQAGI
jgi:RNA polymerase sigma-70 factor, ECF subfamily